MIFDEIFNKRINLQKQKLMLRFYLAENRLSLN